MDDRSSTRRALLDRQGAVEAALARCADVAARTRAVLSSLDGELVDAEHRLMKEIARALAEGEGDAIAAALGLAELSTERATAHAHVLRADLTARLDALPAETVDKAHVDEALKEALAHVHALRPSVTRLENDRTFMELKARGFDEGAGAWWTFSFQRDKARANDVVARHGGAMGALDFRALCARYDDEKSALALFEREAASLGRARVAARTTEKEREELSAALADVDGHVQRALAARVLSALAARSDDERRALAVDLPFGERVVERDGILAKRRVVLATLAHHVERTAHVLKARSVDVAERARRGESVDSARFDEETRGITDDVERALSRHMDTTARVARFSDWARARRDAGALFFDLFVDGADDGAYIDEVVWQRTARATRPPSTARIATWTENAAGAAERLAAIWESVQDAPSADTRPARAVPAPITFDDEER